MKTPNKTTTSIQNKSPNGSKPKNIGKQQFGFKHHLREMSSFLRPLFDISASAMALAPSSLISVSTVYVN